MCDSKNHPMTRRSTKATAPETSELRTTTKRLKRLQEFREPSSITTRSQARPRRVEDISSPNETLESVPKKPVVDATENDNPIRGNPKCNEIKEAYLDLLEHGAASENGTLSSLEALDKNILKGQSLFNELKTYLPEGINRPEKLEDAGLIATQFYWAFVHTQRCSRGLKDKVYQFREGKDIFCLDQFLTSMKNEFLNDEGKYSPLVAIGQLSVANAEVSNTAPKLLCLAGAAKKSEAPKETKTGRRPYRKLNFSKDILQPIFEEAEDDAVKEDELALSTQNVANKMLKTVKQQSAVCNNMLELASAESLDQVLRNFLGLSFLVKDGRIEVSEKNISGQNVKKNAKCKSANLVVKPKKLLPNLSERVPPSRGQTIVSFNAKMLKDFLKQNAAPAITGGDDGDSNEQHSPETENSAGPATSIRVLRSKR